MTRKELEARNEVKWETYTKKIQIEARVMGDLTMNHIIPVATHYQSMLLKNVQSMRAVFPAEKAEKLSSRNMKIIEDIAERTQAIEQGVEELVNARKVANRIADEGGHPLPHRQTGALRQRRALDAAEVSRAPLHPVTPAHNSIFSVSFPRPGRTPRRAPSRFVSPPGHFSFWHAICNETVKTNLKNSYHNNGKER